MERYLYPDEISTLSQGQEFAFRALVYGLTSGGNYFLTGNAGTGKSYLIDVFSKFCAMNGICLMKCAPTGIAATAIGGTTMHRLFRLPVSVAAQKLEPQQFKNIYGRLTRADAIFIDEVSMARIDLFENAMSQIQIANRRRVGNGKNPIMVILSGDFGQLPPVVTNQDKEMYLQLTGKDIGDGFPFRSPVWEEMEFTPLILTDPMRQSDRKFCSVLDNLKLGVKSGIDYLNKNCADAPIDDGIWVCGYNNTAAYKNAAGIDTLPGRLHRSEAILTGRASVKQTTLPETLLYKEGARVVMCMRDTESMYPKYENGSLGTIDEIAGRTIGISLDNGHFIEATRVKVPLYDYDVNGDRVVRSEIGSVTQYPFKIGYAVTIHKSQGQTYDAMNLVPEIFAPGQLYVALSRCRNLKDLYIHPDAKGCRLKESYVMAVPDTVKFLIGQDAKAADFRQHFEVSGCFPALN